MVGKVIELGPIAFRKRDSMEPWVEGTWCEVGDYIRVPKWGGDRWEVPYGEVVNGEQDMALFSVFNDHEIISKVTGDPWKVKAFL